MEIMTHEKNKENKSEKTDVQLYLYIAVFPKVSLLGVDSLWDDCMFIPADWVP